MADVYGFNTVDLDVTTAAQKLYTCPIVSGSIGVTAEPGAQDAEDIVTYAQQAVTQTQIVSIWMAQYANSPLVKIFLTPTDATEPMALGTPEDYALFYRDPIAANSTWIYQAGIVLSPGQTLWANSNVAASITATIFYIEVS